MVPNRGCCTIRANTPQIYDPAQRNAGYLVATVGSNSILSVWIGFAHGASHAQYAMTAITDSRSAMRTANDRDALRRRALGDEGDDCMPACGGAKGSLLEFDRMRGGPFLMDFKLV